MNIKTTNFTNFNAENNLVCPFCNEIAYQEDVYEQYSDYNNNERTYCGDCGYAEEIEFYTDAIEIVGYSYYFYQALKIFRDSGQCNMLDADCVINFLYMSRSNYNSIIEWISNNRLNYPSLMKETFKEYEGI